MLLEVINNYYSVFNGNFVFFDLALLTKHVAVGDMTEMFLLTFIL